MRSELDDVILLRREEKFDPREIFLLELRDWILVKKDEIEF